MKDKTDSCMDLLVEKTMQEVRIVDLKEVSFDMLEQRNVTLRKIGNIVHDSVPVHKNEEFSEVVRTWGVKREITIDETPGAAHHHQILIMLDGYDPKRGQKVAG